MAAEDAGVSSDAGTSSDAGVLSDGDASIDASPIVDASTTLAAADYCETMAPAFCDFYLRCDRMLAKDVAECRSIFLETCNAKYEPRYVDLEQAGLLSLSRAGTEACAAHLAKVDCAEQRSDLDGACGGMWIGSTPEGGPCGPDVESFVCVEGTSCTLSLDLCGTCKKGPPPTLAGADYVGEGSACDSKHRCVYRAYCGSGTCHKSSLLGGPCTDSRGCASGVCEGGTCAPFHVDGASCNVASDCASGQCTSGKCRPLPTACIAK